MSQSDPFTVMLNSADEFIRAGEIAKAATLLKQTPTTRVPRGHALTFAKLCRRAGLIERGLRVLQPLVRGDRSLHGTTSAGERAEYAALLSRIGSITEALALLGSIESTRVPEARLYQGFCHVLRWDYAEASSIFEEILHVKSGYEEYTLLTTRVNLAASLLAMGKMSEAEELLNETLRLSEHAGAKRLVGNILELRGGSRIVRGDVSGGEEDLNSALKVFSAAGSYDELLIRKWKALIEAQRSRTVGPLSEFRALALERRHWESVREADMFSVKLQFQSSLYDHLSFGSPLPAYRARLQAQIGRPFGKTYLLGSAKKVLDLTSSESCKSLAPGQKLHRMLLALSLDFYAPVKLGSLFSLLYPDQYFDVNSSPTRIHQLVKRTRAWLAKERVAVAIESSSAGYALQLGRGTGLKLAFNREPATQEQLRWRALFTSFAGGREFSLSEARMALQASSSSVLRLLRPALSSGEAVRIGQGKAAMYRIAKKAA